jgi:fatty-acid desaturase
MGLVVGLFISNVILHHTTFAINSLCHMFGTRRYETGEESRNSLWLALETMGGGRHNNRSLPFHALYGVGALVVNDDLMFGAQEAAHHV